MAADVDRDLFFFQMGVIVRPPQGERSAGGWFVKRINHPFHRDVAGQIPQHRLAVSPHPEMTENAVQDAVEIGAVEEQRIAAVRPEESVPGRKKENCRRWQRFESVRLLRR